ncbi:hypothetical protein HHI36_008200 [Cryptolaemus montrouzieri]|uniref:Uncharacterized protein n=1 Tax=Cryptolaemus montrouzieri TaxID=559131 RepID=A0ABD2MS94_9CUCU
MGHTLGIHRSSYRLPDDIYQTTKISKLMILMERGKAGEFRGKTLDEIDVQLDEDQQIQHVQPAGETPKTLKKRRGKKAVSSMNERAEEDSDRIF